jgi:hypothetical protein
MKLPSSVAERRMLENTAGDVKQTGISQFFRVQPLFVNCVLNQLSMLWKIRQALPWSLIQDPYLCAASLPAMLAQMVASEFTSDAAIRFKLRRRATE